MIEAVLFDLDDTLYPQITWLDGALGAAADAAVPRGVDRTAFLCALRAVASGGSDRGRIIDRALQRVGAEECDVTPLVAAFLAYAPLRLRLYPGVSGALRELAGAVRTGLVTDGDATVQRAKLHALGLDGVFDVVIFSDDLGREMRKPHPLPFQRALALLGVSPPGAVFIGDRPAKDVAGAAAAGMRAIRVRTGEYRSEPDLPMTWRTADDVVGALKLLRPEFAPRRLEYPARRDVRSSARGG